jgi:chemotaxis protein MotB
MSEKRPVIQVRRVKKVSGGQHGGQWKIAYADFVTAMMAFFLLMWLLGSTTKGDLQGISDYFQTPLKVALSGGSGAGDATTVIQGGGTDITRRAGQVNKGWDEPRDTRAAREAIERADRAALDNLRRKLESAIEASATMRQFKRQLLIDVTSQGLRVQIVDEQNRPMFDLGSAQLKDYTRVILRELAVVLNEVDYRITLSGHTDSKQYSGGERGYSNWELSADRANAARRELIAGGLADNKMLQVMGLGSSVLLDAQDSANPINRRISIVVMNKDAERRARGESPAVEVSSAETARQVEIR